MLKIPQRAKKNAPGITPGALLFLDLEETAPSPEAPPGGGVF